MKHVGTMLGNSATSMIIQLLAGITSLTPQLQYH
jgi:hypothetical protein